MVRDWLADQRTASADSAPDPEPAALLALNAPTSTVDLAASTRRKPAAEATPCCAAKI